MTSTCTHHDHCCEHCAAKLEGDTEELIEKSELIRVIVAFVLFVAALLVPVENFVPESLALYAEFALFFIPYLVAGYDALAEAGKNLVRGKMLDENFLMGVATLGAFALVLFPGAEQHFSEGVAVMLFYKVGELFEDYAVGKSRRSISDMMDIAPDFANLETDGFTTRVSPDDVKIGSIIVVKPGERIPLDGIVIDGVSQLDTAALTGESVPRNVEEGSDVVSGCINLTGALRVRTTKAYADSTVKRILELIEDASDKKARTENFITRFARYYTPIVVGVAAFLAIVPPLLFGGDWADWIQRGLIFLVVSCPCALVISVPLSFFGGIGGASRKGVLVKGSNYLEALSEVDTIVFDKTGTLTDGTFSVAAVHAGEGIDAEHLLHTAAHAEAYSNHPIALSIKQAYLGTIDSTRVEDVQEIGGQGICARVDKKEVLVGNERLLNSRGIEAADCHLTGTILHVALEGVYLGHIVIADAVKNTSKEALRLLKKNGVKKTVMLTGDRRDVAEAVAADLGIDEIHAQLLPQDKVNMLEKVLEETKSADKKRKVAFVGDGINDAPVLMRADVGIAMGAMGSDAAIEAADIVLMDDDPRNIATAMGISRKTMGIVYQNIVFAIGIKIIVLVLAALGLANMWMAVFADVGVAVLAILNAMRALRVD